MSWCCMDLACTKRTFFLSVYAQFSLFIVVVCMVFPFCARISGRRTCVIMCNDVVLKLLKHWRVYCNNQANFNTT